MLKTTLISSKFSGFHSAETGQGRCLGPRWRWGRLSSTHTGHRDFLGPSPCCSCHAWVEAWSDSKWHPVGAAHSRGLLPCPQASPRTAIRALCASSVTLAEHACGLAVCRAPAPSILLVSVRPQVFCFCLWLSQPASIVCYQPISVHIESCLSALCHRGDVSPGIAQPPAPPCSLLVLQPRVQHLWGAQWHCVPAG